MLETNDKAATRRAWKDIAWLSVGLVILSYFWYRVADVPVDNTTFLGQKIVYQNTYHTYTPGVSLPNGQAIFSPDCTTIETTLVVTEDTLVISNSEGVHGFKPLYTSPDSSTLICAAKDGAEVGFTRKIKDTDPQTKENEILVYEELGGGFILFTAKKECFKLNKNSTDKMSDSPDSMSVGTDKLAARPKRHN